MYAKSGFTNDVKESHGLYYICHGDEKKIL
jgi:hypothetical protein